MADHSVPTLSVVVPCFNEEEVLPDTAKQLQNEVQSMITLGLIGTDSHIIFVDDGSSDNTWSIVQELHQGSQQIRGIKLARNRGHQNALLAGLFSAAGDIVVTIDADLQDNIHVMKDMIEAHAAGAEIVLGVRSSRLSDSWFKRVSAQLYYRFLRWMKVEITFNHADYRLLGRRAIEALREYPESNLFLRALILQIGFPTKIVRYERLARTAGVSKYPLPKMMSLALDGVTAFSTAPLRYIIAIGVAVSLLSFMLGAWALSVALFSRAIVPGWASTVVPIYLMCGVQLVCLGIMGEYIGKIYHETKRRPRFTIETKLLDSRIDAAATSIEK
jgi:polyisoprenyl-phosphate glycosyltransferase